MLTIIIYIEIFLPHILLNELPRPDTMSGASALLFQKYPVLFFFTSKNRN